MISGFGHVVSESSSFCSPPRACAVQRLEPSPPPISIPGTPSALTLLQGKPRPQAHLLVSKQTSTYWCTIWYIKNIPESSPGDLQLYDQQTK
jgi:hypothetical protein